MLAFLRRKEAKMSTTPQPRPAGINKTVKQLGMPWEKEYGYAQAVRVGETIYLSGQVSHDEQGNVVGAGNMEAQMRQAYVNVRKLLGEYGATMANVVDEILFVTDMEAAMPARGKLKDEVYGGKPDVASTIVQISRLALPEFMIEIRCTARV
jgi:2-iminobutanoate/2-iminopropanoate deaminase